MTYLLLLANSVGEATTAPLRIRELREFPGSAGISVHFRPVRNDRLFESAKVAGALAYRILNGEGVVRSQLWVEYELPGPHVNVTGRSSDLLFALALITAKWKTTHGPYPAIAATGVLDAEGAAIGGDGTSAVQSVKHTVEKVAAAVSSFIFESEAVVFFPAADAHSVAAWSAATAIPAHIRLHAVASLEDALAFLGISLEKVYLGNPFRGLEYFDYQHRAIFFGRDAEVCEVLRQLVRRETAGSPGLLVEGASGSGKSSFLRAGVLPALVHPGSHVPEVVESLRRQPIHESVRSAIWRAGLLAADADEAKMAQSIAACWLTLPELAGSFGHVQSLDDLVKQRRETWPITQRFAWLVDQFEELFNLQLPDALIERFGNFLFELQAEGVWTLASVRADAVPRLKGYGSLRRVFGSNEGQYYLASVTPTALDDVINRPAQAAGLNFGIGPDGARLDKILREDAYKDRANALPLLQFTLYELYLHRSARVLTFSAYEQLGGLAGSVSTTADAVLKTEAPDARAVSHLFRSLVSVDESGSVSRRYAPMAEITQDPVQKRLLLRLVERRLCVTDQREGEAVVAFAHEALLRTWAALTDWLQREAGILQTRELAQRETRLWQQHGQSDDWLAAADKLVAFEPLKSSGISLSAPVRSFIDRSERRVRRIIRIKRAVVSVIALLAIVATGAGWMAMRKQHEAELQTQEARKAQASLLTDASRQRHKDSDISGAQGVILEVLTNPAFAQSHTADAISAFQEARAADPQLVVFAGHTDTVASAAYSPDGSLVVTASYDWTARIWDARTGIQLSILKGHSAQVTSAAFSPEGSRVVTASVDGTIRIWDARSGTQISILSGHNNIVYSAVYSPDGTRIVSSSLDKTARTWDASTGKQLAVFTGHGAQLNSAAFSPDGTRIVTASLDNTARIWDSRTAAQLAILSGHSGYVLSAMYSLDGARIVTASYDKTARIWDARTGSQLVLLDGHANSLLSAAFSPDGNRVATGSGDNKVHIWDARAGTELAILSGHKSAIRSCVYSPDGTRIITASFDKTARIWDVRAGAQLTILAGHTDQVNSAAYSPDGSQIITASSDRTVRIWNVRSAMTAVKISDVAIVLSAAYSPDATRIATASYDRNARIWDSHTGKQVGVLTGHSQQLGWIAYSPDGSRVLTGATDGTARIWDASTGKQLTVLSGHHDAVASVAYSPDGTRIVSSGFDKTARIWDASTGKQLVVLSGHDDRLSSAVFSPDGKRVITASYDSTARIWDAQSGAQLMVLSGLREAVGASAFSPDGTRIVTPLGDNTVRIWDARTGVQLAVLLGHDNGVESASFSPDGTRIVSASDDGTARIWDANVPADIAAQINWEMAAQIDILSGADRTSLGLSRDARVRTFGAASSMCDKAAAAFYDPYRMAPGFLEATIAADVALAACSREVEASADAPRLTYQLGRALLAKRDAKAALQQFQLAISRGYGAANIDLARLLVRSRRSETELAQAVKLYEKAWFGGVPIAAFELGHFYESDAASNSDPAKAWSWYKKGGDAGEPNALGRLAEREETHAANESDPAKRNILLLKAFDYYAAATQRAYDENWPDDAWRQWRYRRATLARILAREGMMQQVGDAYASVYGR